MCCERADPVFEAREELQPRTEICAAFAVRAGALLLEGSTPEHVAAARRVCASDVKAMHRLFRDRSTTAMHHVEVGVSVDEWALVS
jgi:hypothetical protein